jgi:hypothetical protein
MAVFGSLFEFFFAKSGFCLREKVGAAGTLQASFFEPRGQGRSSAFLATLCASPERESEGAAATSISAYVIHPLPFPAYDGLGRRLRRLCFLCRPFLLGLKLFRMKAIISIPPGLCPLRPDSCSSSVERLSARARPPLEPISTGSISFRLFSMHPEYMPGCYARGIF